MKTISNTRTGRSIVFVAVLVLLACGFLLVRHGSAETRGSSQGVALAPIQPEASSPSQSNDQDPRTPKFVPADFSFPVVLNDSQWHSRLSTEQYYILRQQGTEAPFTGKYWNNHSDGIYYSAATGQPLFSSKDKYDSGTGWPSFTRPISQDAVMLRNDNSLFMQRVEVVDSMSGSHLGHLFDDGPAPTGKRYCMDSAALIFVPTGGNPPSLVSASTH